MNDMNDKDKANCCPPNVASECSAPSTVGSDCCPPPAESTSRWRILVFALVLIAAGATLGYRLTGESGAKEDFPVPVQPLVIGAIAGKPNDDSSVNTAVKSETGSEAMLPACALALDSIASLNKVAQDKDVVFIILPGESEELSDQLSREVEGALEKISSKNKQVAAFTMNGEAEDYAKLVESFSIKSFPSIVVMGRGCGAAAVTGEITEAKLLRAFILASAPAACGTPRGTSASCSP